MALDKAILTNTVTGTNIKVLFNPDEYVFNKEIHYAQAAVPGLRGPLLQFVNGNLKTLEMELFVDTYEPSPPTDVRIETRKITDLMEIDQTTHAPPVLIFTWGEYREGFSFTCVLSKVSQRFVMFRQDGTPVRARLQVVFSEFINADIEPKEVKRETADYSKLHVVLQGETLSAIAGRVYDNPQLWRPIALMNGIDNPRSLAVGRRLLVPQLPYRDPETGEVMG